MKDVVADTGDPYLLLIAQLWVESARRWMFSVLSRRFCVAVTGLQTDPSDDSKHLIVGM